MSGGAFNYSYRIIENAQTDILHEVIHEKEYELTELETLVIGTMLKRLGVMAKQMELAELYFSGDKSEFSWKELKFLRGK